MPKINNILGVSMAAASSNTRYGKRDDSLLVCLESGNTISGKFTNNSFKSAPVLIAQEHLKKSIGGKSVLMINAGNANAGTGKQGHKDAMDCCKSVASLLEIPVNSVMPFSTGVIGEPLKTSNYIYAFKNASQELKTNNWLKASKSILTTDTKPKLLSREIKCGAKIVKITGFAKGSGMIRPDFATLLSFVFVEAKINKSLLKAIHTEALSESFERITVDGDTSPNDSSVLVASGGAALKIDKGTQNEKKVRKAIIEIYQQLAKQLIQDAEGATKEVSVKVFQAKNVEQAKSVAFTVAESPLVKTALFGNDANWGRILSAVGRAKGIDDVSRVAIDLNGTPLVKNGNLDPKHTESKASKAIKKKQLTINIKLGIGKNSYSVMTSDFSVDYLLINSDYRS